MEPYSRSQGNPAFEVRYRFLSRAEGGRATPPRQHVRWDFMYEGDDPLSDGISIVWPQFIDADGSMLPEGEVPVEGRALMFIVNPERRLFHRRRVAVGIRGFFMEGPKKVADCEITAVLGLALDDEA
jgi:hypothetical protein